MNPDTNPQKPSAVIIDDEPSSPLKTFLELNQWQVTSFTRPTPAIDYLQQAPPPHLIISDFKLPEIQGPQLLNILTQMYSDSGLAIPALVLISGYQPDDVKSQAIQSGHPVADNVEVYSKDNYREVVNALERFKPSRNPLD